jgi:hypothetical protein
MKLNIIVPKKVEIMVSSCQIKNIEAAIGMYRIYCISIADFIPLIKILLLPIEKKI